MAEKVIMPKQGLQMTEGTITKWIVREGGDCVSGQPLFEMETDKLVITIDANVSGKLLKILAPEGTTVPITETIAIIGNAGEDIASLLPQTGAPKAEAAVAAAPMGLIGLAGGRLGSPNTRSRILAGEYPPHPYPYRGKGVRLVRMPFPRKRISKQEHLCLTAIWG